MDSSLVGFFSLSESDELELDDDVDDDDEEDEESRLFLFFAFLLFLLFFPFFPFLAFLALFGILKDEKSAVRPLAGPEELSVG
jgi:hypothetical protein